MLASRPETTGPALPAAGTMALVFCLLLPAVAHGGKLYRWVDDDGNIHYTDRMPASATDEEHEVMDERGTVMERRESREVERERREQIEAAEAAERRRDKEREKQRRRDRIIMLTFTTERDILLTREDRVEAVQVQINIVEHNIERLRTERRQVARRLEKLPEDAPPAEEHRRRLEQIGARLEERWANKYRLETKLAQTRARFEEYLKRFHELKPYAN